MFRDWRTTVCGVVGIVCSFVCFAPQYFHSYPIIVDLAKFGMGGGFGVGLIVAQDTKQKDNK